MRILASCRRQPSGTFLGLVVSSLLGLSGPERAQELVRSYRNLWQDSVTPHFVCVGDLDADGHPDLIAHEPFWQSSTGRVVVVSGRTGAILKTHEGAATGELFGRRVWGLPDVNGDGVADYAISARSQGMIRSGRSHALLAHLPWFTSIAPAGDLNLDGHEDFLLGKVSTDCNGDGTVRAYHGRTFDLRYAIETGQPAFGYDIASIDDLDGDGVADFAVGSPALDYGNGPCAGTFVQAFSGVDGELLYEIPEQSKGEPLGLSLLTSGDWNGDGIRDLVANGDFLRFHDGVTGNLVAEVQGAHAFAPIGDVNGNGFGDIVVSLGLRANGSHVLELLDGGTRETLYEMSGPYEPARGRFGLFGCAAGDMDGDEVPDFFLGFQGAGLQPLLSRIDLYSGIHQGQRTYGLGCAGAASDRPGFDLAPGKGLVPGAAEAIHPRIGSDPIDGHDRVVRIHLSRVAPHRRAFLVIGMRSAESRPGSFRSCPVFVVPNGLLRTLTRSVRPGEGVATIELALPSRGRGASLHAQWFVPHPGSDPGQTRWSSSRAIEIRIPDRSLLGLPPEAR